jgi:iron(III) transport system substrate-binding protein
MGSQEVLDRLRSERANPQADVWWGAPSPMFETAARDGLLAPYAPSWAGQVGEYRGRGDHWFGVYLTPEVIAFNDVAVPRGEAPRDWDDVLDPRWRGRIVIRDPLASGTMRTIFGMVIQRSLRETGDTAAGFDWLRRLDAQTREYVLNPTLLYQKLARQEGVVTLWDMPDIEMLRARTGMPIDYMLPTSGTPLVIDAIAVVAGARHPEAARRFVEFVGGEEGVLLAAREFHRLPARGDIPADSLPEALRRAIDAIVPEPMDWDLLQERGAEWMRHWDRHVRGRGR